MADWSKILERGNVEDRRSMAAGGLGGAGAIIGFVVLLLNFISSPESVNINDVLSQLQQTQVTQQTADPAQFEGADSYEVFASTVLGSNNATWGTLLAQNNIQYREPRLVLFRSATQSACGLATSSVGPHYCPADETIYIDETFFEELTKRFDARGGDVAEAYVIAHEVGHHVQNILGTTDQLQSASSETEQNQISVNIELQADCFAGLWASSIKDRGVFEQGELVEALDAAAAVGDDRIQEKVQGRIDPESWTHGSSAQRVEWFSRGYDTGNIAQCDTFN